MKDNTLTTTVMHHLFLWVYNWKKSDFQEAFKTSHLGWEYQWDKFQGNLNGDTCSSSAIIATVLNMDDLHQSLLLDFIVNTKYAKSIDSMDKNKAWMQSAEFEALKNSKK